jgi:ABC-type xylose transport system permease subunit
MKTFQNNTTTTTQQQQPYKTSLATAAAAAVDRIGWVSIYLLLLIGKLSLSLKKQKSQSKFQSNQSLISKGRRRSQTIHLCIFLLVWTGGIYQSVSFSLVVVVVVCLFVSE